MVKISDEISQIKKAIKRLPLKDRAKLIEELNKDSWKRDWDRLLKNIDRKLERFPITQEEIDKEIEDYRREKRQKKHA